MNNINCSYLLLVLFIFRGQVFCDGTEMSSYEMQWNMAKRLGKNFDVRSWVLYHDTAKKDSQWNKLWFDAMKNERSLGYFNMKFQNTPNSSNKSILTRQEKSVHQVTLHLYVSCGLVRISIFFISWIRYFALCLLYYHIFAPKNIFCYIKKVNVKCGWKIIILTLYTM